MNKLKIQYYKFLTLFFDYVVITHDATFHCDELTALALLKRYFRIFIIRTRDPELLQWGKNHKKVMVIDVGGEHEPHRLLFDHHQDINIDASDKLIFDWLIEIGKIKLLEQIYLDKFITGVSDYDTNRHNIINRWLEINNENKYRSLADIVSGYNRGGSIQRSQFNLALDFISDVLENEFNIVNRCINDQPVYENRIKITGQCDLFEDSCIIWEREKTSQYAIQPRSNGNWSLKTLNSTTHPLPSVIDEDDLVFLHKGLFLAVFKTKEAAIRVAKKL